MPEEKKEKIEFEKKLIEQINEDFQLREQGTLVSNGIPYSQAYEYNQQKAINYAPPRNMTDDRQVSMGLVHEKIVSFIAIFLKYVFKKNIKCYDEKGNLVKGMGKIYEMGVEYSHQLEKLVKKIALIYYEVYTQGDAFVLEDWEVKIRKEKKAFKMENGKKIYIKDDDMDYTYEFLEGLSYEDGKETQTRRAVSRLLDGRQVIFGNPEVEYIQDQPHITVEMEYDLESAVALFGSLSAWKTVPKTREDINTLTGDKITLFNSSRLADPAKKFITHIYFNKHKNLFNILCNGRLLLPEATPMTLFYPRGNYPISHFAAERLRGSIYSRSIPAKTKFNADFIDWALKMLANKFEQGIDPAILAKGKWTLSRKMFRGGQVTHGVSRDDYEKADPDNRGVTVPEFSFVSLLKDIVESQTLNPTTSGELSSNATATEISTVENNQRDKLSGLLDGLIGGYMDLAERRAETIESKYTIKQRETLVDGKTIKVYQNFTVNTAGVENVVVFDDTVGEVGYDTDGMRDSLFTKSFLERKNGFPTEYYLVNPNSLRKNLYNLVIEIVPEKIKDTHLSLIQLWDDFAQRLNIFGAENNMDEMKKEYLETTGKPDAIFTSQIYKKLDQETGESEKQPYAKGSFGQPNIQEAARATAQRK